MFQCNICTYCNLTLIWKELSHVIFYLNDQIHTSKLSSLEELISTSLAIQPRLKPSEREPRPGPAKTTMKSSQKYKIQFGIPMATQVARVKSEMYMIERVWILFCDCNEIWNTADIEGVTWGRRWVVMFSALCSFSLMEWDFLLVLCRLSYCGGRPLNAERAKGIPSSIWKTVWKNWVLVRIW